MRLWTSALLALALSAALPAAAVAQSAAPTTPSLSGDWRIPAGWVVVIDQKGMDVRGDWKQSYQDKALTCSGVWFEGKIEGERITGSSHPCGFGRPRPLDLKIIDANTLELTSLTRGGATTSTRLRRVRQ